MDRVAARQARSLERQLFATYSAASRTAIANERRALERLARNFATADEAGQRYLMWNAERHGGVVNNIAAEIANVNETARRMISGEALNIFAGGYRETRLSINRQLRDLDITANMQLINRSSLNAVFNGEHTPLGAIEGFQGSFQQVGFREVFEPAGWEQVQIARRGDGALLWRDRLRGRFYYDTAIGRLGDSATIVNRLRDQLGQALILGESIPQITRRVQDIANMTARQARTIARTETIRAYNQGKVLGAYQAQGMGIPLKKRWMATLDERVRDTHEHMNMELAELDEPFSNGLMYPLDPNGEANEVINCRCTFVTVVSVSRESQAYRDLVARLGGAA